MEYEYAIITVNPSGKGSVAAAVLLRTIADDRLYAKVRDDLGSVLTPESVEVVDETVKMFAERSAMIGATALLTELEDTLSNFLTIGPRSTDVGSDHPSDVLDALTFEYCSPRV